jgi:hypothetical protein
MLYHETLNETLPALQDAIMEGEKMPDHIRDRIRKQTFELTSFGETLQQIYDVPVARGGQETIGPILAQAAAAGLDVFCRSGFLDIGKPDATGTRPAYRMRAALLRDAGEPPVEGNPWPDPSEDPERRPFPPEQPATAAPPPAPTGG